MRELAIERLNQKSPFRGLAQELPAQRALVEKALQRVHSSEGENPPDVESPSINPMIAQVTTPTTTNTPRKRKNHKKKKSVQQEEEVKGKEGDCRIM
jgi:hypothetical protein